MRGVERVDVEKRQIWFRAAWKSTRIEMNRHHLHFCRINFGQRTGLVKLTAGDGTHAIRYSPDGRFFLDTYSRVDLPATNELRRTSDGALVCLLEKGDMSALAKTGWRVPGAASSLKGAMASPTSTASSIGPPTSTRTRSTR